MNRIPYQKNQIPYQMNRIPYQGGAAAAGEAARGRRGS